MFFTARIDEQSASKGEKDMEGTATEMMRVQNDSDEEVETGEP